MSSQEASGSKEVLSNKWNTAPLTKLQIIRMEQLMELSPDADSMYIESVVRMPPDKLSEIVRRYKAGELEQEVVPEREYLIKGAIIIDKE